MTPGRFRRAYLAAVTSGYGGTKVEFARLIMGAPFVFAPDLTEAVMAWLKTSRADLYGRTNTVRRTP
jgi:hypothetical protein